MDFNNEEIYMVVRYNLERALNRSGLSGVPSKGRLGGCSEALECIQRAEHFYAYLIDQAITEEQEA